MRNTETQATTERIIERYMPANGDGLDNTWQPIATLRGFTHPAAIQKLSELSEKFGYGKVRMR